MIEIPISAISTWGAGVVFLNVLLTRLGVPLPAVPVLLFAGSAIAGGVLSFWHVLSAAVLGALIGDGVWFAAGRIYGLRLIAALGKLSPYVETRVGKARSLFERFGAPLVSVSKFVPGLAFITPPLMGTTPVDPKIYASWDLLGATAWAMFWLLGGAAGQREFNLLMSVVRSYGASVVDVLVVISAGYLIFRLIRRWRLRRWLARAGISPGQFDAMARSASPPVILDARPQAIRNGWFQQIPGALPLDLNSPGSVDEALLARDIVVYCICPDEMTAREISQRMHRKGFKRIRALKGGLDAWQRRGYPMEPSWLPASALQGTLSEVGFYVEGDKAVTLRSYAPGRSSG